MKFYGEAERLRLVEDMRDFLDRKGDAFAEPIDCVDQPFGLRLFHARQHDLGDVIGVAAVVFDRRRMRGEIGGHDADRPDLFKRASGTQNVRVPRRLTAHSPT